MRIRTEAIHHYQNEIRIRIRPLPKQKTAQRSFTIAKTKQRDEKSDEI